MRLTVLGGPHDGLGVDVPSTLGENQMFLIDGYQYFFNKPKEKPARLIYYTVSKEV